MRYLPTRQFTILSFLVSCVFLLQATHASATLLLFDGFDGDGLGTGDALSTNGGFTAYKNPASPTGINHYTASEDAPNSVAVLDGGPLNVNGNQADGNAGNAIISNNGFAAAAGIKATWVIADARFLDSTPGNEDRVRLTISKSNNSFDSIRPGFGSFKIELDTAGANLDIQINNGSNGATNLVTGQPSGWVTSTTPSPLTVMAELDAAGYKVTLSSTATVFSGLWAPGVYDRIQTAGISYISAGIQGDTGSESTRTQLRVDSIQVVGPDEEHGNGLIPEPSALVLAVLGLATISLKPRRSRQRS